MTILQFMSDSPYLTFFLTLIISLIILQATVYIIRYIAYAIRGNPDVLPDDDDDED